MIEVVTDMALIKEAIAESGSDEQKQRALRVTLNLLDERAKAIKAKIDKLQSFGGIVGES